VTTRPRIRTSELTVLGAGRVPDTGEPVMHSARGEGPMLAVVEVRGAHKAECPVGWR